MQLRLVTVFRVGVLLCRNLWGYGHCAFLLCTGYIQLGWKRVEGWGHLPLGDRSRFVGEY